MRGVWAYIALKVLKKSSLHAPLLRLYIGWPDQFTRRRLAIIYLEHLDKRLQRKLVRLPSANPNLTDSDD